MAKKPNMELFLQEIFQQFIAINDADYRKCDEIFKSVFKQMKEKMSEVDSYFAKYSSQDKYAGSVYDGIKVGKLDEFDMDIVIRLPINMSDPGESGIVIESYEPGFVKLKIGKAFDHLDNQQDWEKCHKVTREWRDADKYFLQNKFRFWMQGTVQKAINLLERKVIVNGLEYKLEHKEAGPAFTLKVRRDEDDDKFELDVDLVPVIRFMLPRWPEGYRAAKEGLNKEWLVVPKPIKSLNDHTTKNRCWRLAFHDFERDLMKGCDKLKQTIRLVKKLRDALGMKEIASYYIKTLFLWEIDERNDKTYWQNKVTPLFRDMVGKLHAAVKAKRISYYWHKDHNLIKAMKPTVQKIYYDKLQDVINKLDANDMEGVAKLLLTKSEMDVFKECQLYKTYVANTIEAPKVKVIPLKKELSIKSNDSTDSGVASTPNEFNGENSQNILLKMFEVVKRVEDKVDTLVDRVSILEDKLLSLEMKKGLRGVGSSVRELNMDELNTNQGNLLDLI